MSEKENQEENTAIKTKPLKTKSLKTKHIKTGISIPSEDTNRTRASGVILRQDIGLLLLLLGFLGAALIVSFSDTNALRAQNVILMMVLAAVCMLSVMRAKAAAVIAAAMEILFFTMYKLFLYATEQASIEITAFLWPAVIVITVAGALMFIYGFAFVEQVNHILNDRVGELTVIDPLTGIQNLRGLYATLFRVMSNARRHPEFKFGLLMIRLRYAEEIRKVLTAAEFNELRVRIAGIADQTLRLEDEAFTIDDEGSVAVMFFSSEDGAAVVKDRLMQALTAEDAFPRIRERTLQLDFSIVYRMYEQELERDAMKFVQLVENEFAYEV